MNSEIPGGLERILQQYSKSFAGKVFSEESSEDDDLMLVFALTQTIKSQNRQYWGRELGMCWQLLVTELCKQTCDNFRGPVTEGKDQLCDLVVGSDAIDTKYRIGSGDSGTLKKFVRYGLRLRELSYRPVVLILRRDNLPAAIAACVTGGWTVMSGDETYHYLQDITGFDMEAWLKTRKNQYATRP